MAQITLYIDEDTQIALRDKAARLKVSQSQYVVGLIRQATSNEWPPEVLALFGSIPDFPLAEELRANQPPDAPREVW